MATATAPALALLSAGDVQDLTHAVRAMNMTLVRVEHALSRLERAISGPQSDVAPPPAVQLESEDGHPMTPYIVADCVCGHIQLRHLARGACLDCRCASYRGT